MQDDRWQAVGERYEAKGLWIAEHPVKALVVLVAIFAAIGLVGGALGWWFSWVDEGKRITGPANSREQFTALIGDYRDLEATAGNVCNVKDSRGAGGPTLVEDPAFAYKAQYRRIKADYDRRMANAFEAGIIRRYPGLNRYPRAAPPLSKMMERVC